MAVEAEGGGDRYVHGAGAWPASDDVDFAGWVLGDEVRGRRDALSLQAEDGDGRFDGRRSAESVADHTLDCGNRRGGTVVQPVQELCLDRVAQACRGAVGVDVSDVPGGASGVGQCGADGAFCAGAFGVRCGGAVCVGGGSEAAEDGAGVTPRRRA